MNSGYDKSDVKNWAGAGNGAADPAQAEGQADDGADADAGDEDDEPDAGAKDICDILKKVSGEIDESVKALKGYTMPDETSKAFKKKVTKYTDALEELKTEADDLVDEHEEEHEESDEEDDDDEDDSDDEDSEDEKDDDEGADDESDK